MRRLASPKERFVEVDDSLQLDKKSPKLSQRHNNIPFVPLRSSNTRSCQAGLKVKTRIKKDQDDLQTPLTEASVQQ